MKLALQTALSAVLGLAFFALVLFVPAGTFAYWQAWVLIAVISVSTLIPSVYLALTDPETLRRRMRAGPTAEQRPVQRVVMSATVALVVAALVLSALDHRFGWSEVPLWAVVLGDVLVAVGMVGAQAVVIANRFAGSSVRVEPEQVLVTTGLYGVVRHPMYAFGVLMMVGIPPALDSLWGLVVVVPALGVLAARLLDEERMLFDELPGYLDYSRHVRYRLIPHVW